MVWLVKSFILPECRSCPTRGFKKFAIAAIADLILIDVIGMKANLALRNFCLKGIKLNSVKILQKVRNLLLSTSHPKFRCGNQDHWDVILAWQRGLNGSR